MSVSATDLFGNATPELASGGSYGEAPSGYRLPEATRLGVVRLEISRLDRSLEFYEGVLGLRVISRTAQRATLGALDDDTPLVELNEVAGLQPAPRRGRLGLYHVAILLPTRESLGAFVRHLGEIGAYAGAGDHLVSEAFYLQDPDNLGIEVYADRPRDTWRRLGRELMLATDPVDVPGLVAAADGVEWRGMPKGTMIGHVHLHVGDIAGAREFFSESLGFDRITWRYPGALFLGAGGYHHHLGTNTWAGSGAQPPTAQEARLLEWTIVVPTANDVQEIAQSLTTRGFSPISTDARSLLVRDPWQTAVRVISAS